MNEDTYGPIMSSAQKAKTKDNGSDDDIIGPSLPPHLRKRKHSESDSDDEHEESSSSSSSLIGPTLPPHLAKCRKEEADDTILPVDNNEIGPITTSNIQTDHCERLEIGPAIPTTLIKKYDHGNHKEESSCGIGPVVPPGFRKSFDEADVSMGPALPPDSNSEESSADEEQNFAIGPVLPPGFKKVNASTEEEESFGPALPPGLQQPSNDCNDDDVIGPLPYEMMTGDLTRSRAVEIEQRASKMKDKLTNQVNEDNTPKRESWMTELPTGMKKDLGLTARSFRTRAIPEKDKDTSAWTDTPADKDRKLKEGETKGRSHREESFSKSKQEKEYEKAIRKHDKSKRGESLIDMHEKKMKKKKKKEKERPKERQPFDRDRDLQVNRFDDAQRKSIIKKSQLLNTRFSHGGSTSSFL